jgi:hypothetical protein
MISYVTLELFNTWANYARAYILSCALLPLKEDGVRITLSNPSVRSPSDALKICMHKFKPKVAAHGAWTRRDEPAWHKPSILIQSCVEIGCSNLTEITRAFSIATGVFDDLPRFRHFYAHRNEHTVGFVRDIARKYSIDPRMHPTEVLCTPAYGRPQIILLDWIDDISVTVQLLCA